MNCGKRPDTLASVKPLSLSGVPALRNGNHLDIINCYGATTHHGFQHRQNFASFLGAFHNQENNRLIVSEQVRMVHSSTIAIAFLCTKDSCARDAELAAPVHHDFV